MGNINSMYTVKIRCEKGQKYRDRFGTSASRFGKLVACLNWMRVVASKTFDVEVLIGTFTAEGVVA